MIMKHNTVPRQRMGEHDCLNHIVMNGYDYNPFALPNTLDRDKQAIGQYRYLVKSLIEAFPDRGKVIYKKAEK